MGSDNSRSASGLRTYQDTEKTTAFPFIEYSVPLALDLKPLWGSAGTVSGTILGTIAVA
jgi:hypothetical protein